MPPRTRNRKRSRNAGAPPCARHLAIQARRPDPGEQGHSGRTIAMASEATGLEGVLAGRFQPRALSMHRIEISSLTSYIHGMALTYSIYEAKARFSEVIRQVRGGRTVTISYRGEPVAEIHAIQRRPAPTLEHRLEDLERGGALVRPARARQRFRAVARRPGALARFLSERGE